MSKSAHPTLSDPWETPPVAVDPELLAVSQRLMARSAEATSVEPEPEPASDPKALQIAQLQQEKQQLWERNVSLTLETARLRAANQQLLDQIAALRDTPHQTWWSRLIKRVQGA